MKSKNIIKIKSKIRNYEVLFTENFNFIKNLNNVENIFFIDSKIYKLYNKIFENKIKNFYLIQSNEESKTLEYANLLYRKLIKSNIKKKSSIIAVGGGVIQDISGFVASTFHRGTNWIYIPTTLLAQADSCIGSKTSINFDNSKNLIGTFYPPSQIYINVRFIETLSKKDLENGLGEIIKIQLIDIRKNQLGVIIKKIEKIKTKKNSNDLAQIIQDSLRIKKVLIEKDEFDKGIRNLLNYGHTLGHAIEAASNFQLSHGTAILIGISFANLISVRRKILDINVFDLINNKLVIPNINKKLVNRGFFSTKALLDRVKSDKKRTNNNLSFIIPNSALKLIKIDDIKEKEFIGALDDFRKSILPILST